MLMLPSMVVADSADRVGVVFPVRGGYGEPQRLLPLWPQEQPVLVTFAGHGRVIAKPSALVYATEQRWSPL